MAMTHINLYRVDRFSKWFCYVEFVNTVSNSVKLCDYFSSQMHAFTCKLQQVSFNDNQCKILISKEFLYSVFCVIQGVYCSERSYN